jgi:hypothetical protein
MPLLFNSPRQRSVYIAGSRVATKESDFLRRRWPLSFLKLENPPPGDPNQSQRPSSRETWNSSRVPPLSSELARKQIINKDAQRAGPPELLQSQHTHNIMKI